MKKRTMRIVRRRKKNPCLILRMKVRCGSIDWLWLAMAFHCATAAGASRTPRRCAPAILPADHLPIALLHLLHPTCRLQ